MALSNQIVAPPDAVQIARAATILRDGGLVAFPTETVYGLGADATNDRAVAGIFEAKGRPRFNPLIVHVRDTGRAHTLVEFTSAATALAERFWPGPLTLVLPRKPDCPLSLLMSAGLDTVALRVPAHPIAQQLLAETNLPIAAPSANRSGRVSPTTAAHVANDLGERVQLILDGGATPHGIESTVIGFDGEHAVLLRPGAIAREDIEAVVGHTDTPQSGRIVSPGQLASHYAPHAALRLEARDVQPGEVLLAFGPDVPDAALMRNLSHSGDVTEAAANLFAMLRELDTGAEQIAVMPIPERGLGEAINDRLRRAAAPRDAA
ncbi:MAG TPA: L-threonylcarbamoyladenylate synthase [Rhizomicrobium sp.]|jgi:L-threonylcarbamoyladenylate synthase|nr:L-threonylcarbamoyladenylate synthase [Rhizomicrobium sp.]